MNEKAIADRYKALDDDTILPEMDRSKPIALTFMPKLNGTGMFPEDSRCFMLLMSPWAADRDGIHGVSNDAFDGEEGKGIRTARFYPWRYVLEAFQMMSNDASVNQEQ